MGKAGSMPAGGMTVAVSYGGSEGTDEGDSSDERQMGPQPV
jgi:hypothetical protein